MTALTHILVVDDQLPEGESYQGEIKITQVKTAKSAREILKGRVVVDLLILDWILDPPDDSTQAQGLLADLQDMRFLPVLIWTNQSTLFERPDDFPEVAIKCVEKLPYAELMVKAKEYFAGSLAGKLADPWRTAVHRALELSLYDLARASSQDLIDFLLKDEDEDRPVGAVNQILSHILHEDPEIRKALDGVEIQGEAVPAEDAITTLQGVLTNRVMTTEFREQVSAALQAVKDTAASKESPALDDLVHAEKYYTISDSDRRVRPGDVVDITMGSQTFLGLVLTPGCDLYKTRFLRMVLLEREDLAVETPKERKDIHKEKVQNMASLFVLKGGHHYVANFHDLVTVHVPLDASDKYLWANSKETLGSLKYDMHYETRDGQPVGLTRLYRLDDPYRSDIIQRFSAHASRIGIPALRYRDK